jgi:elongation factor G
LVQATEDSAVGTSITAMVPLAGMFGYATSLRSLSKGRATFAMTFDHYEEIPAVSAGVVKETA